jgi:hypothetical protein
MFRIPCVAMMLAFAMGLPVSIYDYSGNACDGASYVALAQ